MRKVYIALSALIFVFACGAKKKNKSYFEHKGYAVGTSYLVEYDVNSGNLDEEINKLLRDLDVSISSSNPTSALSKINGNDTGAIANKHILSLFALSAKVYKETNGSFDPTLQPVINWWGRDVRKFVFPELIDSAIIDSLKTFVGFSELTASSAGIVKKRTSIQLNFNGIYEGYVADQLADLLARYNISNYRIEVGGKIRAKGTNSMGKPWEIGLDEPTKDPKARELMAIARLNDQGFAIAGSYRDFYTKGEMKFPFTIDPVTLYPVKNTLLSAAVFAPTAAEAEVYANAFMVMGTEKTKNFLASHPGIEVYLISTNYKGEWTPYFSEGLKGKLEFVREEFSK
jgi:thiamine biosynthesis lipoprotein